MNELSIRCETKNRSDKPINLEKLDIFALLKQEVDFRIMINEKLFFREPLFPILEFLSQINPWISEEKKIDFAYNSIETEENPLLSFSYINEGWKIRSPWQQFESDAIFSKQSIVLEITKVKTYLNVI